MAWELTGNSGTTSANFLGTTDAQPLSIKTNNSERMRLTTAGELLIGTTASSAGARLRVAGGGATINNVAIGTDVPGIDYPEQDRTIGVTSTSATLRLQSPNGVALHSGPSGATLEANQRLTITVAGDVGIGTTTPAHKLDVAGTINATSITAGTLDATDIRKSGTSLVSSQWADGAGGISYGAGNVGIGALNSSYKLNVDGAINATSITAGTLEATDIRKSGTSVVSSQWSDVAAGSITYGGNVGIGKSAGAAYRLDAAGPINATDFHKNGSSVVSSQWANVAGGINYGGGSVGIAKAPASPYKLDVAGPMNATDIHKNGKPLVESQWVGTSGSISYAGNVSINGQLNVARPHSDWMFLQQQRDVEGGGGFHVHNPWGVSTAPGGEAERNRLEIGYRTASGQDLWGQFVLHGPTGNVGIGTGYPRRKLDVAGLINATDYHRAGRVLVAAGRTLPGVGWQQYGTGGVFIDVNTAGYHFTTTPVYVTSIHGNAAHWGTTGGSSVYNPTPTGFRVYIRWWNDNPMTVSQAQSFGWHIQWIATETS